MMLLEFLFFATLLPAVFGSWLGAWIVINEPIDQLWRYL